MKTWQVKLTPLSSFHGFPTSDTLFGAICWGIKRMYDESTLTAILKDFQEKPKFILSSTFPYTEYNGNSIPFYPKPITSGVSASDIGEMAKTKEEKIKVITQYKKFKKAEYVSLSILERMLNGTVEKTIFQDYHNNDIKLEGRMLMAEKECPDSFPSPEPPYKNELIQKNSLDRLTMSTGEEGQTFYQTECFTSHIFKLHFLIKTVDIDFFRPIFRYLEDKGIGGNRSTGKGRFKIDVSGEVSIGDFNSRNFITLSRYIHNVGEIKIDSAAMFYEIFPYRSKVDSEAEFKGEDVWKSRVMYIKEGSYFEAKEKREFYGRLPVVKEIDGQKIYQNGLAFPVFGNFGGAR